MLIQTNSNLFRPAQEDHALAYEQLGTVMDAAKQGLHLVWEHKDAEYPGEPFRQITALVGSIKDDVRIRTREGYSTMIVPLLIDETSPVVLSQIIETDWWPGAISIYFQHRNCVFKKGVPFAQVLAIPRQGYSIKQMSPDVLAAMKKADDSVKTEKDLVTRTEDTGYVMLNNTYQVLKYKNERNDLPAYLKAKRKPKLRLGIQQR